MRTNAHKTHTQTQQHTQGAAARENSEDSSQRTVLKGVLTRLSGSTGFQLINVSNAPIALSGKTWNNLLVNKVGIGLRVSEVAYTFCK